VEFVVPSLEIHLRPRPVKPPYVSSRRKRRKSDRRPGPGHDWVR
jgi:hypothetical protein